SASCWGAIRLRRATADAGEGFSRTGPSLACAARERYRKPVRGVSRSWPLKRAAGFEVGDGQEASLQKLQAALMPATDPEDVALLAELLSLPAEGLPLPSAISPQRKKERLMEALLRQAAALARQNPLLMLVEDAHWIDPSSRELLDLTIERILRLPVLLLVTFRPEFKPLWVGWRNAAMLTLNRLSRLELVEMVGRITGGRALPDEVLEQIVERTDGVPLFVEELTHS